MSSPAFTFGFANLSEAHSFAVTVRESLEAAVARQPQLKLIVRDNAMDDGQALRNAQEFAQIPVDLAMIYHLGERVGPNITSTLLKKNIRMIAIDIPIPPWAVYFGVNNRQSGTMVGEELGKWVNTHWDSQVDKVLIMTESRVLDFVRQRLIFALEGLASQIGYMPPDTMYLESGNERLSSAEAVSSVLQRWSDVSRIAVIGFNDETALGALDAARDLGREADMIVVGQGGNLAPAEICRDNSRLIASVAYYPEQYGERLVDLALRMLTGEKVSRENFTNHIRLTRATIGCE